MGAVLVTCSETAERRSFERKKVLPNTRSIELAPSDYNKSTAVTVVGRATSLKQTSHPLG